MFPCGVLQFKKGTEPFSCESISVVANHKQQWEFILCFVVRVAICKAKNGNQMAELMVGTFALLDTTLFAEGKGNVLLSPK